MVSEWVYLRLRRVPPAIPFFQVASRVLFQCDIQIFASVFLIEFGSASFSTGSQLDLNKAQSITKENLLMLCNFSI